MQIDHIQASGATIAVRKHGTGPAVLCLHATGQGWRITCRTCGGLLSPA